MTDNNYNKKFFSFIKENEYSNQQHSDDLDLINKITEIYKIYTVIPGMLPFCAIDYFIKYIHKEKSDIEKYAFLLMTVFEIIKRSKYGKERELFLVNLLHEIPTPEIEEDISVYYLGVYNNNEEDADDLYDLLIGLIGMYNKRNQNLSREFDLVYHLCYYMISENININKKGGKKNENRNKHGNV